MLSPMIPSVDQLLVLLVVAEEGSFTAAAKRLGRATSAISYAIDTLERDLGLSLFHRGTSRKPKAHSARHRTQIEGVQLIPVAAPSHPLAKASEAAPLPARDFVQLVLSEQPAAESRD